MRPEEDGFSLQKVRDLPTLPLVASRALAVAENPSSTPRELLEIVMSDPPVASRILRVANSPYFRREREISDLQTAILHLGFRNVRNLLLAVTVMDTLTPLFQRSKTRPEDLWNHSSSVAAVAARIAGIARCPAVGTTFSAGLLHDIGKLILNCYLPRSFECILDLCEEERLPFAQAERRVLLRGHAALGAELLESWNLPSDLTQPVRWHHEPQRCPEPQRSHAFALEIADYAWHSHAPQDPAIPPPPREHLEAVGLTAESLSQVMQNEAQAVVPAPGL